MAQFGFGIALLILGLRSPEWSGAIVFFCMILGVVGAIDSVQKKRKAADGEPR